MMIWFAGLSRILNNTCCNNVNKKIKQIQKRICECDVFWHKYAYWMTLSAASVCFKGNKQITNFFISATLEIAYFPHGFLNFFKREWRHIFLGVPSQDRKWILFSTLFLLLGCVLEETHDTNYLKVGSQVLNGGQKLICTLMLL